LARIGRYVGFKTGRKNMTDVQLHEFRSLANQLSPENLHCDGEVSRAEANRRYRRIMKRWRALEKAVGRKVDGNDAEICGY
jgi:hypothetical protein